jgi:tRNA(Ile)-lysidine synthase
MHQFVRHLVTEWRSLDLPFAGGTLVVAVSGGTDSNSLLIALQDLVERKKIGHRVVAAHFNHRLRADASDADENYVKGLTTRLGIELAVGHAKLPSDGNVEQNARHARYRFLTDTAKNVGAFALLTAHTVNDQAETFLINLLRGSGPKGLSGMSPVRPLELETMYSTSVSPEEPGSNDIEAVSPLLPFSATPILLVRPLLRWAKRRQTEGFCSDLNVECCHDAMNDDTAFRRVRIRKILLPLLEDFNPKIVDTLAQTAELMADCVSSNESVPDAAASDFLTVGDLKRMGKRELNATIKGWLTAKRGSSRNLQLKHFDAIGGLISSEKSGRVVELPGGRVVKASGRLIFEENKVENADGAV